MRTFNILYLLFQVIVCYISFMMYSKSLKFSIVLRLFLCNRPTFQSGSTLSVYEVSLVFRQKVRGAVVSIFCNINVNLFLSSDKFKTLPGNTVMYGNRSKREWEKRISPFTERESIGGVWKRDIHCSAKKKKSHESWPSNDIRAECFRDTVWTKPLELCEFAQYISEY